MKILDSDIEIIQKFLIEDFQDPFAGNLTDFATKGSKFIRSKLALLYFKAQGVNFNEELYNILAIGELIHNASLLQDDVLDNAEERRGVSTFYKKYDSKIAVLAGDYLLTHAIKKLININNIEIFNIFQNCIQQMTKAEINQYFLKSKIPTKEQYLEICKGKTAQLFIAILESCAILLNLNKATASKFAELFGICFQINNDLETKSMEQDKSNEIYTANNVLGIEKTRILLDNYKEEMRGILSDFPDNIYKQNLEDLVNNL